MTFYKNYNYYKTIDIKGVRYPKIVHYNDLLLFGSIKYNNLDNINKYLPYVYYLDNKFNIIKENVLNFEKYIDNYFDDINKSVWIRDIKKYNNYLEFLIEIKTNINNTEYVHKNIILKTTNLINFELIEEINDYPNNFIFYVDNNIKLCSKIIKTNEFWGKYLFENYINNISITPQFDNIVSYETDSGQVYHSILKKDNYYEVIFSIRKKIENYKNYSNNLPYIYKCYISTTNDFINFYNVKELKLCNYNNTTFYSYPSFFEYNNDKYIICNQDDFGKLKTPLIFKQELYVKFLDLNKNIISIRNEINKAINYNINNTNFINGKQVNKFENNFANYIGVKHCVGVGNGTDALEIAIKSLNLPNNSEIITQSNTFYSTCSSIINSNCKLILADINDDDYMINIDTLEQYITPNTKVIIPVHLYGHSADMDSIMALAKKYNLYVIEDCAQAHGCLYKNKKVGCFGDLACFSFYPGKNLGAFGDGGCIVSNNDILIEKIRKIANLGCKEKYNHEIIGRNSRLDTIQASILDIKLKYLDENNQKRLNNYYIYEKYLNKDIKIQQIKEWCKPVVHLMIIQLDSKIIRNKLKKYLMDNNIESGIHYPINIQNQQAFKNYIEYNKNLKDYGDCILSLPMYPELEEYEIKYICNIINLFYNNGKNN